MSNIFGLQPFVVVPSPGTKNAVPIIPVVVASPPAYSAMPFVWHVDVLLVVAFGLFVLCTLPRAAARYAQRSERFSGLFLRARKGNAFDLAAPKDLGHPTADTASDAMMADDVTMVGDHDDHTTTDDSHTLADHALVLPQSAAPAVSATHPERPPRHVRNWAALSSPALSYALNYPVARGTPLKLLALLLAYFGVLIYTGTRGTSPFTDPRRSADIAVAQLPFVIAFAQKNNILAVLSGMGYEKVRVCVCARCGDDADPARVA
jgi:ferric-chelate reductase